jgi:hypothetical protein
MSALEGPAEVALHQRLGEVAGPAHPIVLVGGDEEGDPDKASANRNDE